LNDFKIKEIGPKLLKIQNTIEAKAKKLSDQVILKLIENKSNRIRETHLEKQMKNKNSKILVSLAVEKRKDFGILSVDSNKLNTQKQSVKTISIKANIAELKNKIRLAGFMHPIKNQASICQKLIPSSEVSIIKHYNSVMQKILNWFSGASNFSKIKGIIESIMRHSCLLTLKKKFKLKNIAEAKSIYTANVNLASKNKPKIRLISREEVIKIRNSFNIRINPITGHLQKQIH
jgi:hypothetical protein